MKIGRMVGPAIATHSALVTGVHGVGDDNIISDAEVTEAVGAALTTAITAIGIHDGYDTGVHGVGESTVCSVAELAAAIAAQGLTVAKTEVFSGNSPNPSAWTDLDINAVVGANVALVILAAKCADGSYLAVRQNGDTDQYYRAHTAAFGAGFLTGSTNVYAVLVVLTSASGVIEWKAATVDSPVVINVLAYVK